MDLNAALDRLGGNRQLLADVIQFFLEDAPKLLDEIRGALQRGDSGIVHRASHSLKGLAANFEAEKAVDAALTLEGLAETGHLETASKAFEDLETEVQALEGELTAVRQQMV